MALRSYRNRTRGRRRRKILGGLLFALLVAGVLFGAGYYAWRTGEHLAARQVVRLNAEIARLNEVVTGQAAEIAALQGDLAAAETRAAELAELYQRDVPRGALGALTDLARERIDAGIEVDRLRFVIANARNDSPCRGEPETRRFLVRTPLASGANDAVAFAKGAVTVTAEGFAATDENGNAEAWFDPDRPVRVQFVRLGGEASVTAGVLPLHQSLVIDDRELRFSVIATTRGFVEVTADVCDYP